MSDAALDPAALVRQHLLEGSVATLCTTSVDPQTAGFPFGSVVPYALDGDGAPLILISRIAQHTRNLRADPRAALLVRQPDLAGDPQAGWRVTVVGRFTRVDPPDERVDARYVAVVPGAAGYSAAHDFDHWRLDVVRVRWIGGFGQIEWVPADVIWADPKGAGLAEAEAGIVAHMNADHADALVDYCVGLAGFRPETATLESVERTGFFLRTTGPERLVFVGFGRAITADEARAAFIERLTAARGA